MPVDWTSIESWQRLVAAIVATDIKIDVAATAAYYGTTYNTLENRFRIIKAEAKGLKEMYQDGEPTTRPTAAKKKGTADIKKPAPLKDDLNVVKSGRVVKRPSKSSTSKDVKGKVKGSGSPEENSDDEAQWTEDDEPSTWPRSQSSNDEV